uniref:Uncharacterized protein n=1 Tax=Chromera velia CCMP2878 TaxID=1169474 RepID=A0A0G4HWA1_9ALVE|eukprot:Cvel_1445.t1-p1 / transcript=Cvel_1445.t1 / gene=Cvel_1445 / organism=Chromera_velia_CCMP2878 / gene_product=hypothetical protein / transcript_product=hypothetical protein / location=Cvel_scaffold50:115213-115652(-) / protein_length=66 / sequence_SO=supercontig / SO=protein_coding / is_pseudo=false
MTESLATAQGRTVNEDAHLNYEENNAVIIVQGGGRRWPRTRKTRSADTARFFLLMKMTNRPSRSLR